jgi:ribonuclease VapC
VIIDASAVVAILLDEPEAGRLVEAIASAPVRRIGAPTLVEAAAVLLARKRANGEIALDTLLERLDIDVVAMEPDAAAMARSAYRRYGKGIGSPGVLNYGDCLSYGIAMALSEPLLCKGDDFAQTDVLLAAY